MILGSNNVTIELPPRPIEHSYWVVPGRFLAGEYPRDLDEVSSVLKINALLEAGVTRFVDLTEEGEGLKPYAGLLETLGSGQSHHRFPVVDLSIPKESTAIEILKAIDAFIEEGERVYLHCWGGVGRTGTMIGCWLARNGFQEGRALEQLNRLWQQCPKSRSRRSPETEQQRNFILNWRPDR